MERWCRRCGQVEVTGQNRIYCPPCREKQDRERKARYYRRKRDGREEHPIAYALYLIAEHCAGPNHEDCSLCPCECAKRRTLFSRLS